MALLRTAAPARWLFLVGADTEGADVARKRKVPDAADFDLQRARLWQWLVENAGADPNKSQRIETRRINAEGHNSDDPLKKRAGAIAGSLLDLDMAATERATARWYLQFRADTLDTATQAIQSIEALRKSWRSLAKRVEADRPAIPPMASLALEPLKLGYWPEEIMRDLAARDAGLFGALVVMVDYRAAVKKIGENVWGADTTPDVLKTVDNIALHLSDGGFSPAEIADLLDETGDARRLKVDRWRKRVEWARKVTRRSTPGAPISVAVEPERTQTAPYAARRHRPRPDRTRRRRAPRTR